MRVNLRYLCLSFSFGAWISGAAWADDQNLRNPLPLTRIALVTDLDAPLDPTDPGTGGGFQTSTYFQTKLASASAIAICSDYIEAAAAGWAKTSGLVRMLKEKTATTLSLNYSKAGLKGLFVIRYSIKAQASVQVRVDYYRLDGAAQAPESATELLNVYQIAGLQDDLDKALLCKRNTP